MIMEKIRTWLKDPNKSWFKLWKFVLSMLRGLLFLIFLILALHLYRQNILDKSATTTFKFPIVCFIALLIFNWRFIISLILVVCMIIVKITEIICCCLCVGCLTNRFLEKFINILKKLLIILNWSQLDWPCFLNLKYYVYILDTMHYLTYLIAVVVIFFVELFALDSNFYLLIVFIANCFLFIAHLIIEFYRIVQSKRVEQTIRDIFTSDLSFSRKAVAMISEDQLGSRVCVNFSKCQLIDSQHHALSHPKDVFKKIFDSVPYNKLGVNLTIGFHQTTIDAARSILTTGFKPSKTGMLGPGIYFANNYDATDHKRNQSTEGGAIFCAVLDLGRVLEIQDKTYSGNYSKYFNSKYLHHGGGEVYDEFVVYRESQVIEYTIIVEQEAINSYRERHTKRFCNCI